MMPFSHFEGSCEFLVLASKLGVLLDDLLVVLRTCDPPACPCVRS
jgi:hypothetical protein